MAQATRTKPVSLRCVVSGQSIERLVAARLDIVESSLDFRPDVHFDWPAKIRVSRPVADAIGDALEVSLERVAQRRDSTSAFVSVALRRDTVELCVIDDGAAYKRSQPNSGPLAAAVGVEHDVDDFDEAGVCQWWSIPLDSAG